MMESEATEQSLEARCRFYARALRGYAQHNRDIAERDTYYAQQLDSAAALLDEIAEREPFVQVYLPIPKELRTGDD